MFTIAEQLEVVARAFPDGAARTRCYITALRGPRALPGGPGQTIFIPANRTFKVITFEQYLSKICYRIGSGFHLRGPHLSNQQAWLRSNSSRGALCDGADSLLGCIC